MSNETALQHLVDCKNMTATMLRHTYKREANSHRNMHSRKSTEGRTVHPAFKAFRDFLLHVGPCPCARATLDRIDNNDPEYGPGKVRWADKRTQNSNKGDSLLFYYSRTGDTYTVSRLVKLQKVTPSAIRKRKERGWNDDEIIEGEQRDASVNFKQIAQSSAARHRKRPNAQPEHTPPPRDIMWDRRAALVARYRKTEGQEYCIADYETLVELTDGCGFLVSKEGYDWKFAKWWAEYKPHVVLKNLPPWAQDMIARIKGTNPTMPLQAELRDQL